MTSDGIPNEQALVDEAEQGYDPDKLVPRRVTFIGQPSAGKSELAGCCGEPLHDGIEIPHIDGEIEIPLFDFVGMLHTGRSDLARRAKDIVRGNDGTVTFDREEALKHIVAEDDELLRRLASNDGPVDGSL